MKSRQNALIALTKLLSYVLGRHPDEFGLVPDPEGCFRVKDLLKAIAEEPGWGFVRSSHLKEVLISIPGAPFEVRENRVRAVDREHLPRRRIAAEPPKLLYTCVRERAYPHVLENGILPSGHFEVILAADPAMARRIGYRSDSKAVLVTVQISACQKLGCEFFTAGDGLYTAKSIPAGGFTGPPPHREAPSLKANREPVLSPKEPGSYLLRLDKMEDLGNAEDRGSKKEKIPNAVKGRKRRDRFDRERPPWRR